MKDPSVRYPTQYYTWYCTACADDPERYKEFEEKKKTRDQEDRLREQLRLAALYEGRQKELKDTFIVEGQTQCKFGNKHQGRTWMEIFQIDKSYVDFLFNLRYSKGNTREFLEWVKYGRRQGYLT